MKLLRAMREPLKYVQGKGALLKFKDEMGYMGKRWLFVCSKSGYKACHDQHHAYDELYVQAVQFLALHL